MKKLSEIQWEKALDSGDIKSPDLYSEFILQKVSRTFALNIQILPAKLKKSVRYAYLFCRMADTIEDDHDLSVSNKSELLGRFKALFPIHSGRKQSIEALIDRLPLKWKNSPNWDQRLLYHSHWIFGQAIDFSPSVTHTISKWVKEMCDGMDKYTKLQINKTPNEPLLQDMKQLDDYCYYVAGTVGHLLSDLFYHHSSLISQKRYASLTRLSVSFGLGLQLTNILKDVFDDLERNILFLPANLLGSYGVDTHDFRNPENREKLQIINHILISKTMGHLKDAISYTCLLPRLECRIRLFCLWPLFMAADTLILLAQTDFGQRRPHSVKITRAQVKRIIRSTSLICWSNALIKKMFQKRLHLLKSLQKNISFSTKNAGRLLWASS